MINELRLSVSKTKWFSMQSILTMVFVFYQGKKDEKNNLFIESDFI